MRPLLGRHEESGIRVSMEERIPRNMQRLSFNGAEDGIRTRDPLLGKEMLYR